MTSLEGHDTIGESTIGAIVAVQETGTDDSISDFGKRPRDQDCIPQDSKRVRFDLSLEAEQSSKTDEEVVEDVWKRFQAYKFYFQNAFDLVRVGLLIRSTRTKRSTSFAH